MLIDTRRYAIAAVAVAILVAGVAWWRILPRDPSERVGPATTSELEHQQSARQYSASSTSTSASRAVTDAVRATARDRPLSALSPADGPRIAQRAGELTELYRSGSMEDFVEWLRKSGQQPYRDWLDVDNPEGEWARRTATVRDSAFEPREIEVVVRAHGGKAIASNRENAFIRSRSVLEPELNPLANPLDLPPFLVPGAMRA
jgi:hypothetical protein